MMLLIISFDAYADAATVPAHTKMPSLRRLSMMPDFDGHAAPRARQHAHAARALCRYCHVAYGVLTSLRATRSTRARARSAARATHCSAYTRLLIRLRPYTLSAYAGVVAIRSEMRASYVVVCRAAQSDA